MVGGQAAVSLDNRSGAEATPPRLFGVGAHSRTLFGPRARAQNSWYFFGPQTPGLRAFFLGIPRP
jgi:hypothetical protein